MEMEINTKFYITDLQRWQIPHKIAVLSQNKALVAYSLSEIKLFDGNGDVAVSVICDTHEPTPRVARTNDLPSHRLSTL